MTVGLNAGAKVGKEYFYHLCDWFVVCLLFVSVFFFTV